MPWNQGYPTHGALTYTVSASLDMKNILHTETEIVFDWTNSGSTVTEQTKMSNQFNSNTHGTLDARLLLVSGNVGSGNGSVAIQLPCT